ncbi:hypothetical protein OAN307_c34200 [Octadecabacter antarcticus 307]|uniref:Uncharacterized protein n=1 Tax=Octadecabacter antarcticus 307 TaxID=391626 RepID=M9R8C0_9RHOB|nr:hypothetical protein [Octadecabacter antarcticus]AGI68914.1 hypothetical protein OAN307_c34200 [Octadecabacter antarcticus 307]
MSFPTKHRMIIKMRVQVEDRVCDQTLPPQLLHPALAKTLCLRASERRLGGHTTYHNVSRTLCDRPTATPDVD